MTAGHRYVIGYSHLMGEDRPGPGNATKASLKTCSYLHGSAISRPREIVSLCASSFRAAAQNSAHFHVFALSLRMGQRQLVLSQFRHRLRRRRTPEPHRKDFYCGQTDR